MRLKKEKIVVLLLICLGSTRLQAQEAVTASGGNSSGSGGSISYSAGQVFYTTSTETTGSVIQGVQLPYEISALTGIEEARDINLYFTAYPNPVNDFLILKVDTPFTGKSRLLSYELFDMNGALLVSKKIEQSESVIPMEYLIPSTYILKVSENSREVKIFKIIKN